MPKVKRGLGQGLSALYAATTEEIGMMSELPIDKVVPNPNQPRKRLDQDKVRELARSIEAKGLIEPIIVRRLEDGRYEIIAGERRWMACKSLGMKNIRSVIRQADDREAVELALIENLHRDDLNAIEEARGFRQLIDSYGLTQQEVAQQVAKSRSSVANSLRLLELPEDVQEYVLEGRITSGHARALLSINDLNYQRGIAQQIVDKGLTVRDVENIARLKNTGKEEAKGRTPLSNTLKKIAKRMRKELGTDVRVTTARGKHKIVITFKDEDDLKRICSRLLKEDRE